jgi:hypothetical protein
MPVHLTAVRCPDLPVCPGLGCGLSFVAGPEDSLTGLCSGCWGLYLVGTERERHAGCVPVIEQADLGPVPGGRVCSVCRRWFCPAAAESCCGGCLHTVEFGRELVGDLLRIDLG